MTVENEMKVFSETDNIVNILKFTKVKLLTRIETIYIKDISCIYTPSVLSVDTCIYIKSTNDDIYTIKEEYFDKFLSSLRIKVYFKDKDKYYWIAYNDFEISNLLVKEQTNIDINILGYYNDGSRMV